MDLFDYDLHTHTVLSDGRSSVAEMYAAMNACGLRGMALTDHSFGEADAERLLAAYAANGRGNAFPHLLFGTETCVADLEGAAAVPEALLGRFDLVLMDFNRIVFEKLPPAGSRRSRAGQLAEIMVKAAANRMVTIMAHPFNFGRIGMTPEDFHDGLVEEVARAWVAAGKVFELMNQMYYWYSDIPFERFHREYLRIVRVFLDCGSTFSIGSDTHSCCGVGNFRWVRRVVEELKIPEERFFLPEAFRR